jgi:hypothetical protein
METGAAPAGAAGFVPNANPFVPPVTVPGAVPVAAGSGGGPNPSLAGILAGFFPFGVGAVYTGQYAKGLAHLSIFALIIVALNASDHSGSEALGIVGGFGLAFFYVYQIIDAVRSAKAIQAAQPIPDPFGLASTFGGGAKVETSKIPMGAIVLILLGVLFLLHTLGLTEFGLDRFWPLILILVGAWMFARNWGITGKPCAGCQCARCRTRRIMGPAIVLTIGVLFLLQNFDLANLHFGRTWPVILLVIGAVKLLQGSASVEGHIPSMGAGGYVGGYGGGTTPPGAPVAAVAPVTIIPPAPPVAPTAPVPPAAPDSEVNRG